MWYDVRYYAHHTDYSGATTDKLVLKYQKTPARSAAEALEAFGNGYHTVGAILAKGPLKAVPLTNEWDTRDKGYWYEKWRNAMAAMPYRIRQNYTIDWVPQPKGQVPLPTFIEGRAKNKMTIIDGAVCVKMKTVHSNYEYGRASALGILLGYITWTGKDHKRKRANSCAMLGRKIPESSRPRQLWQRELLANIGGYTKEHIAEIIAEKRRQMNE